MSFIIVLIIIVIVIIITTLPVDVLRYQSVVTVHMLICYITSGALCYMLMCYNPRQFQNKRSASQLLLNKVGLCFLDAQSCDVISAITDHHWVNFRTNYPWFFINAIHSHRYNTLGADENFNLYHRVGVGGI